MKLKSFIGLFVSMMLVLTSVFSVYGEELLELSLDDATKMALAHSTALISEALNGEISQEKMDDINPEDVGDYNKTELLSYLKQAASYANSKLSQQVKEESVKFSLKKTYIEVINHERAIALEKTALQNTAKELEVSRVKTERGLLSAGDWQNQKLAYEKSEKQLREEEADVEAAYRALSILIGKDENTKYHLSLEPSYEKLTLNLTLDGYINNKLAVDLNVMQQVRNLDIADSEKLITSTTISDNVYADLEASKNLTTAELTLLDTKTQLRNSLLNCYNSIIALEESIEMNEWQLVSLEQALAVANTKLERKTGTQIEVNKAEAEVKALESTITEQIYEHMLLMEQFDKSYLL